jgi:hypothetical protein
MVIVTVVHTFKKYRERIREKNKSKKRYSLLKDISNLDIEG